MSDKDIIRQALVALENATPIMNHYDEPCIRHSDAIKACKAALAEEEYEESVYKDAISRGFDEASARRLASHLAADLMARV